MKKDPGSVDREKEYQKMYARIFRLLDQVTPLWADCGLLCGHACCKGDERTGMRLFPHEESVLAVQHLADGGRLAVCNGTCQRSRRPLACRIFPFFPTIDERGKIFVEKDYRAARLCPLITHSEEIIFDPRFFKAVKKVGKILAKDAECRAFLEETTRELDLYAAFLAPKEE